jgi:hypothetical protein
VRRLPYKYTRTTHRAATEPKCVLRRKSCHAQYVEVPLCAILGFAMRCGAVQRKSLPHDHPHALSVESWLRTVKDRLGIGPPLSKREALRKRVRPRNKRGERVDPGASFLFDVVGFVISVVRTREGCRAQTHRSEATALYDGIDFVGCLLPGSRAPWACHTGSRRVAGAAVD